MASLGDHASLASTIILAPLPTACVMALRRSKSQAGLLRKKRASLVERHVKIQARRIGWHTRIRAIPQSVKRQAQFFADQIPECLIEARGELAATDISSARPRHSVQQRMRILPLQVSPVFEFKDSDQFT